MEELNERLTTLWPCCLFHAFGYLFCLCTCGLSFLLPLMCVSHAKICSQNLLNQANMKYAEQGVHFELKIDRCITSEIVVVYGNPSSVSEYLTESKKR